MNSGISLLQAHALYLAEELELTIQAVAKMRVEEDNRLAALALQIVLQQIQKDKDILASEQIY